MMLSGYMFNGTGNVAYMSWAEISYHEKTFKSANQYFLLTFFGHAPSVGPAAVY